MSLRSSTSTPAVGSSKNRTRGSWANALAIRTRRFIPPDNSLTALSRLSQRDRRRRMCSIAASSRDLPNKPREKRTVLMTFSNGSSATSCGTKPIKLRAARKSSLIHLPATLTSPDVTEVMPQIVEINVVLPAPLGPSRAIISPSSISRFTPFSASNPPS